MPPRKRPRQQRSSRTSRRSPSPATTNASPRPLYEARAFFDECSICLCDFEPASDCAFYPCRHFVHHACHVTWMSNQRPVADSNASAPSTDNPIQYPPGHHIPADFVRRHDERNLLHAQRELVAEPLPDPLKDALLTALRNGQVLHEDALAVIRGMSNVLTRLPYLLDRWLDANGVSIQQRYAEFRVHCSICQQPYHPVQIASVPYSEIVMPSREPEPEPESQQEQDAENEDGGGDGDDRDDRDDDAGRSASSASASSAPYATRSSSSSSTSPFSSSSRKEIEVIVISSDDEDDDYDRGRDRDDDHHHHNNDDSDDSDDDGRSSSSHHPFVVHGHHRRRVEPDEIIVIND